jgi:hypothetical protein
MLWQGTLEAKLCAHAVCGAFASATSSTSALFSYSMADVLLLEGVALGKRIPET